MARADAPAYIADRGYHHYDGIRLGLLHSLWVITWGAIMRAMGMRRPFRTKIMPWALLLASFAPAVLVLGIRIVAGSLVTGSFGRSLLPSDSAYTSFFVDARLPVLLFAGLAAPDVLCPDRREQVLSLYFVSPITRLHYVFAKLAGVILLLIVMSVGPLLLYFAGSALLANDTAGFLGSHGVDVGHLVLAGVVMSVYFAVVATTVAAFNDRRAFATGTYIGLMLVSGVAAGIIVEGMRFSGHNRFALLDLGELPVEVARWIFRQQLMAQLDGWVYGVACLVVVIAGLGLMTWQYGRGGE